MARVFISYQRADTLLLAHCLRYAMAAEGHEVFVDTAEIPTGAVFPVTIDDWLARTDLALLLVGPRFDVGKLQATSSAVAFEWRRMRFYGSSVLPVLYERTALVPAELPADLRWVCTRNARFAADRSFVGDVDSIVASVGQLARPPRRSRRALWIDDNPKNNEAERRWLRQHHAVTFDNVVSTREALEQLQNAPYDLVLTDLGRGVSGRQVQLEGLTDLATVTRDGGPPVIVYTGKGVYQYRNLLLGLGAFGATASPSELYALVDRALGGGQVDAALER